MSNKTKRLLRLCKEAGYTRVSIGEHDEKNTTCASLGPKFSSFSVCCSPRIPKIDGWPALWRIAEKCGISYGCGNGHQIQPNDLSKLTKGVYVL